MNPEKKKLYDIDFLFIIFLFLHVTSWALTSILSRHTINRDTVEAFNWGNSLSFGYDKNPYLPGFVAYLAMLISDKAQNAWGYYLLQQIFIGAGFIGVYLLAKRIVSKEKSLISVLILEGCFYFNAYVQSNNDNYILIGLVPWSIFFFYKIFYERSHHYIDYVLFGLFCGLSLMTKYSYFIFLFCLLACVISQNSTRSHFKHNKHYLLLSLIIFLLLCIPNVVYLYQHNFITIEYLINRSSSQETNFLENHILNPLNFIWITSCNLTLSFVLFLLTGPYKFCKRSIKTIFVIYISLMPISIIIMYFFISGSLSYWEWGVPFVIYAGLLMAVLFDLRASINFLYKITIILIILGATLNILINKIINPGGSADFPACEIAEHTEKLWKENTNLPLKYIGGSRYLSGYISYYSHIHPKTYNEWNHVYSNGINDCLIKKNGAIFVQNGQYGTVVKKLTKDYRDEKEFPKEIYSRFPSLKILEKKTFYFYNQSGEKTTILFGMVSPNPKIMCDYI